MDKIDQLLEAIEYPERYSDEALNAMLTDPELREVYEMLNKTKASLTPISAPDVDAEWKEFERTHRKRSFHIFSLLSRNVAASIAIGLASLAAVAAVVGVRSHYLLDRKAESQAKEVASRAKVKAIENDTIIVVEEKSVKAPETIVFDNEPLETIVNRIAEYYGYAVEFSTDAPKSLRLYFRWNQAQTLDEVLESLDNFEQIHLSVKDKTIKID